MSLYNVTFVLTCVIHKHIKSDSMKELQEHLQREYSIENDYYGPAGQKIVNEMMKKISDGEFYITSFVSGFNDKYVDEIANNKLDVVNGAEDERHNR